MRRSFRFTVLVAAVALLVAACGDDGSVLGGTGTTDATTTSTMAPTTSSPPETTAPAETITTTAAPAESTTTTTTTEAPPSVPVVTPDETTFSNDDPPLEIRVVTPVVSGVPAAAAGAINGAITGEIGPRWTGFRDDILGSGGDPSMPGVPSEYDLDYEATAVTADILSLRLNEYYYYQGAAHGGSTVFTFNFDPQTGAVLGLADVLVPGTAANVASRVEQALIDDLYGGDAAEASSWLPVMDASVLDAWVASEAGLEFSFDQYEVGPGVMGSPTVVVPWADLAALIDPDGPAGPLAFG